MPYKILSYGLSDVGLVRQNNEDVWAQLPDEQFYIIADGMGGHQAGEIAARQAVDTLCTLFKEQYSPDIDIQEIRQNLILQIQEVNDSIFHLSRQYEGLKGMGTTLCCVLLHPEGVIYGHVGDSRIYRFRDGHLEQLTQDHSLLRELLDLGQISEEKSNGFGYKHILTKAIGTEKYVEPCVKVDTLHEKDLFLLCSDGLTDLLTKDDIEKIISHALPNEIPKQLIKLAKQRGGHDNVTVLVIKVLKKYGTSNLSG